MQNGQYQPDSEGALTGVRIVDMTRLAAGNMVTRMLVDFGAEVIKIERPETGDDLRDFGEGHVWWKEYGRSKKSFSLNFRTDEGAKLLLALIEKADMLVENFVPGTLEKWGLGPDDLWKINPGLIIVRVSGYGQTGPYSHKPGFGTLVEAMTGFAEMTGFPDKPPLLPPMALADMIAGIAGFGGALAALFAREKGRAQGQVVDLSLFEPLFSVIGPWQAHYTANGKIPEREGNCSKIAAPRNTYQCADGKYLALSASMQSMWEKVAINIGREELIHDPRFLTGNDRIDHMLELDEIVADYMRQHTLDENLAHFGAAGVTVGPICNPIDLKDHEFIHGRAVVEHYPDDEHGSLPLHTPFPRLSETPGTIRSQAPDIGQHNDEILEMLGVSGDERERLRDKGIV
jgi:crotonobetainyl-CoA:carnitine CoA-transferase CaiB-like acyl-CoA transferase